MRVWRICKSVYAASVLSGNGASYVSGRWHVKGSPVVYTAANPSLAALETLVHVDADLEPPDLRLIEIDVPDTLSVERCDPATLTAVWRTHPPAAELQTFGSMWLGELRTVVLRVPSAVIDLEDNILINPRHPDAREIRVVREWPFAFDPRLLG